MSLKKSHHQMYQSTLYLVQKYLQHQAYNYLFPALLGYNFHSLLFPGKYQILAHPLNKSVPTFTRYPNAAPAPHPKSQI